MSGWDGVKEQIEREIRVGGELKSLCPFCGLPLCERSDYTRCSKCGVNWLVGEDLNRDPRIDRFNAVVAVAKKPTAASV